MGEYMGEIRLYYKIEDLSGGWSKFYYYNGLYNNSSKKLDSYNKRISKSVYHDLLNNLECDNNRLLYCLNEIEYARLLNNIENYKSHNDDVVKTDHDDSNYLKRNIFNAIRLKVEFMAWFKYSGYPLPKV